MQSTGFGIFLAADVPVSFENVRNQIVRWVELISFFASYKPLDVCSGRVIQAVHIRASRLAWLVDVENVSDNEVYDLVEQIDHCIGVFGCHLLHFERFGTEWFDFWVVEDGFLLIVKLHEIVLEGLRLKLTHTDGYEDVWRPVLFRKTPGSQTTFACSFTRYIGPNLRA